MKKPAKKTSAFTLVEILVSLTILAMLMTAVAFAFDASVTNYQQNKGIYETVNRARQVLLRITNDLRTASAVALEADDSPDESTKISFFNSNGDNICYRFDSTDNTLYYDKIADGSSYVLCKNVTSVIFERTEELVDLGGATGTIWLVRDVRIVLTVTDDDGKVSKKLAAATLIRKNQYD